MGSDLSSTKESHPNLYRSVVRAYNSYAELMKKDSNLRNWTNAMGGMDLLDRLSDALLLDPVVLALGDQSCTAMYPMLQDMGTAQVPARAGNKIKLVEPYGPCVFAVLETALVHAVPTEDGPVVLVASRDGVVSAVPVKMTKLWAGAPGVQYAIRDSDGDAGVIAAYTCDLLLKSASSEIQRALTTW